MKGLPFWIMGTGSFIAAALVLKIPETATMDLPDSMEAAEEFGTNQKLFEIPILNKARKRNQVDTEISKL
jgi:hypothetical protein